MLRKVKPLHPSKTEQSLSHLGNLLLVEECLQDLVVLDKVVLQLGIEVDLFHLNLPLQSTQFVSEQTDARDAVSLSFCPRTRGSARSGARTEGMSCRIDIFAGTVAGVFEAMYFFRGTNRENGVHDLAIGGAVRTLLDLCIVDLEELIEPSKQLVFTHEEGRIHHTDR
jgi:hypothetical protein